MRSKRFDKGLRIVYNGFIAARGMVPEGGKAKVTKDNIQKELEWMRRTQKDQTKEPEVKVDELQEELDWMRKQARDSAKKPEAEPEQASPEQREATDEVDAELDELHKGQMEPVEQDEPAPKGVEQSEEDKEPPPAEEEEVRFYVVKRGDSLSKISKEVYGDGGRWKEIYQANKDKIKDPRLIYAKQKLRIP